MPLRSWDLFSGIGGMTLALGDLAQPLLYCEINPFAVRVLQARMQGGQLPTAPVCRDVRSLTCRGQALPQLLLAGFPCQGFSSLGLQTGFAHDESGLFGHTLRLIDEGTATAPGAVFLENVPAVLQLGMDAILPQLLHRGYDVRWCVLAARDVGAPHERRRWFCLAVRPAFAGTLTAAAAAAGSHGAALTRQWLSEPPASLRMTLHNDRLRRARVGALGNAVVPATVRAAFLWLAGDPPPTGAVAAGAPWPPCGRVARQQQAVHVIPRPPTAAAAAAPGLVFDPTRYRPPSTAHRRRRSARLRGQHRLQPLRRPVRATLWATPRHALVSGSQFLTERTEGDLPTQVRFERRTPARLRHGQLHPGFVEWLMGFPAGWTRVE